MTLPPIGRYVLIHLPRRQWRDGTDPDGVFWKVAKRIACDHPKRPGTTCGCCEDNNRGAGWKWQAFGPDSYWAHEVTRWEEVPR